MGPDRLLSTSSQGLTATSEIEAPCFFNYGSRTLLRYTNMAGLNLQKSSKNSARNRVPLSRELKAVSTSCGVPQANFFCRVNYGRTFVGAPKAGPGRTLFPAQHCLQPRGASRSLGFCKPHPLRDAAGMARGPAGIATLFSAGLADWETTFARFE